jgi:hypothetical protein
MRRQINEYSTDYCDYSLLWCRVHEQTGTTYKLWYYFLYTLKLLSHFFTKCLKCSCESALTSTAPS